MYALLIVGYMAWWTWVFNMVRCVLRTTRRGCLLRRSLIGALSAFSLVLTPPPSQAQLCLSDSLHVLNCRNVEAMRAAADYVMYQRMFFCMFSTFHFQSK